ncbi:MAG: aminotransferase class III-fold pyridoxal phosphate-dependent enzyme [Alphaproteobacteria bacterium]
MTADKTTFDPLAFWANAASQHWDGQPTLRPLYGEYDLNFHAREQDGSESVLKVMRVGCTPEEIDFQIRLISALTPVEGVPVPQVLNTDTGRSHAEVMDPDGQLRLVWRVAMLPGATLDTHAPTSSLAGEIGAMIARMHLALSDFRHPSLDRTLKWDLSAADWIGEHLSVFTDAPEVQAQIGDLLAWYGAHGKPLLQRLPQQAIHNDLNQQNLLAKAVPGRGPQLSGVIDFGDSLYNPRVADLAIAGAYLAMDHAQPIEALAALVKGYCGIAELSGSEIDALWPLVLMRLAVSVTNSGLRKVEFPDDAYVVISEKPALALLAIARDLDARFVALCLREAAGLPLEEGDLILPKRVQAAMFDVDLSGAHVLDLTPHNLKLSTNRQQPSQAQLNAVMADALAKNDVVLGRYGEARLIYGGEAFGQTDHVARRRRTVHIGIDVFLPPETPVCAVFPGVVISAEYRADRHDYGGTLILEHECPDGTTFRALYGHLSRASAEEKQVGQRFAAGEVIAHLGDMDENGGWPPHLHLQVSGADASPDAGLWPGVVDADHWSTWERLFPNPAVLLGIPDALINARPAALETLKQRRKAMTAANLKLSYRDPINMIRGEGSTLTDAEGRRFLDAYNNVPHVGHAHPHVAQRVAEQVQRLSTNTRYLSELHLDYMEHLLSLFPEPFDTCFLVNSGSEANEVAMRLAGAYTGRTDMAVSEVGYHGITQKALDISHYKFAGPGGQGQADWVHVLPIPNTFSGPFQGPDAPQKYAAEAADLISGIGGEQATLAGCLLEIFPSVGGQLIPPQGYLRSLEGAVKAQGGLLIADEVQTGLGRLGSHFWAFEHQGLQPDIVVLGKPIGNGHPMGAVITRKEIADSFSNGMEFFSTFGGSTVSCAAGKAVLEVIETEKLTDLAEKTGTMMLDGLKSIFADCSLSADVRGLGLFLGVELCHDDGSPATEEVGRVVNAMRKRRILMGSDGPHDSVLKIRPPICFSEADATFFLEAMNDSLRELSL